MKEQELANKEEEFGDIRAELEKIQKRSQDVLMKEKELANKEKELGDILVPRWWKNPVGFHLERSLFVQNALEAFLRDTSCCHALKNAKVVRVERIENEELSRMYQIRRSILQTRLNESSFSKLAGVTTKQPDVPSAKDLDQNINEFYLFHGTSSRKARTIAEQGFDERVAGMGGWYGAGSYFASAACKSHQHADKCQDSSDWVVMVCGVTMGWAYETKETHINSRHPPDNPNTPGRPFDSILPDGSVARPFWCTQHHHEYVVFDKCQVYPEYIVHYQLPQCLALWQLVVNYVFRIKRQALWQLQRLALCIREVFVTGSIVFVVVWLVTWVLAGL